MRQMLLYFPLKGVLGERKCMCNARKYSSTLYLFREQQKAQGLEHGEEDCLGGTEMREKGKPEVLDPLPLKGHTEA